MSKTNYVLVKFNDGDYRVYTKRVANKTAVKNWNHQHDVDIHAEVIMESRDKDALLGMANLARYDFAHAWKAEEEYDYTDSDGFIQ